MEALGINFGLLLFQIAISIVLILVAGCFADRSCKEELKRNATCTMGADYLHHSIPGSVSVLDHQTHC